MRVKCLTNVDNYKKGEYYEVSESKRVQSLILNGYLVAAEEKVQRVDITEIVKIKKTRRAKK